MKFNLVGSGMAAGVLAIAGTFLVPGMAQAAQTEHSSVAGISNATSLKAKPGDVVWHDEWHVTGVGANYYSYPVAWRNCQQIYASNLSGTASCEASATLSATVTGNMGISAKDISASVGFSVTESYSLSSSRTFNIPTRTAGWLKWRPTYIARDFTETEFSCTPTGSCVSEGITRTGTAQHYDTWGANFFKS